MTSKENRRERLIDRFNIRRGPLSKAAAIFLSAVALSGCAIGKSKSETDPVRSIAPELVVPGEDVQQFTENFATRLINIAKSQRVPIQNIKYPHYTYPPSDRPADIPKSSTYYDTSFRLQDTYVAMTGYNGSELKDGAIDPEDVGSLLFSFIHRKRGYELDLRDNSPGKWEVGVGYRQLDGTWENAEYITGLTSVDPGVYGGFGEPFEPLPETDFTTLVIDANQVLDQIEQDESPQISPPDFILNDGR